MPNIFIGFSKTFVTFTLEHLKVNSQNYSEDDLSKIFDYINSIISSFGTNQIRLKALEKDYCVAFGSSENTLNQSLDEFYHKKENQELFLSSRNNLLRIISVNLKKVYKKLENINTKLEECNHMELYKIYGELLTAELYKINANENLNQITVNNYYENNTPITIPLDHTINIQKNIQKYFKKYNKLKNALSIVGEQKKEAEKELDYIESIVFSLENAKSMEDILEVYTEISENIMTKKEIMKKQKNKLSKKKVKEKEIVLQNIILDGFTVYIGKNNVQNDYLTLKFAHPNDIWFHTQKIHGSHILLRNPENVEIPEKTLLACAKLAKENSKAKLSSNVPVDYTKCKYVKKSPSAKPGLVIYTHYKTMFVK